MQTNACAVLQSEATASKYNLCVPSTEAVKSRTRQRKPQYVRDDNFVMPSGSVLWMMSAECIRLLLISRVQCYSYFSCQTALNVEVFVQFDQLL